MTSYEKQLARQLKQMNASHMNQYYSQAAMNVINQQAWTSATANTTVWPLPSVVAPQNEYAIDRDARLTPVEWLERQIDDVCRLARAA